MQQVYINHLKILRCLNFLYEYGDVINRMLGVDLILFKRNLTSSYRNELHKREQIENCMFATLLKYLTNQFLL